MKKELLKGLSEEQIAKIKACKSQDELLVLAKEEGVELSEEQLSAVSGGGCFSTNKCPKCGSDDYKKIEKIEEKVDKRIFYKCKKCGEMWRR